VSSPPNRIAFACAASYATAKLVRLGGNVRVIARSCQPVPSHSQTLSRSSLLSASPPSTRTTRPRLASYTSEVVPSNIGSWADVCRCQSAPFHSQVWEPSKPSSSSTNNTSLPRPASYTIVADDCPTGVVAGVSLIQSVPSHSHISSRKP